MVLKTTAWVIVGAALMAGCASEPASQDTASGTASPTPSTPLGVGTPIHLPAGLQGWLLDEPVETLDCKMVFANVPALRDRVQPFLPPDAIIPGRGPVSVLFHLSECPGMMVGNRSLQAPASLVAVYVVVERPDAPEGQDATLAFPLEFSSSLDLVAASVQAWGIYSELAHVSGVADASPSVKVQGTTDHYEFTLTAPHPTRTQTPKESLTFWGNSTVAIEAEVRRSEVDQAPSPCVAAFHAGRLAALYGQSVPSACIYSTADADTTLVPTKVR